MCEHWAIVEKVAQEQLDCGTSDYGHWINNWTCMLPYCQPASFSAYKLTCALVGDYRMNGVVFIHHLSYESFHSCCATCQLSVIFDSWRTACRLWSLPPVSPLKSTTWQWRWASAVDHHSTCHLSDMLGARRPADVFVGVCWLRSNFVLTGVSLVIYLCQ